MLVNDIEDILFFQCQQCFEFPKQPKQCERCHRFYCRNCNKSFRQSSCRCDEFSDMDPILRHIYDNLTIICQNCKRLYKLNEFQDHKIKCGKNFQISELITNIKCIYCQQEKTFDIDNIINKCDKCQNSFFKQQNNLVGQFQTQEYIEHLQNFIIICNMCYLEGNKIQMINHQSICNQVMVSCMCGSQLQRSTFKDHFKLCLQTTLQKEKYNLDIEQIILNAKNIEISQKRIFYQQSYLAYSSQIYFVIDAPEFSTEYTKRI